MKDEFPDEPFILEGYSTTQKVVKVKGLRFEYSKSDSRCAACGSIGTPWAGWFHCEGGRCVCFAFISTGETLRPASVGDLVLAELTSTSHAAPNQ